MHFNPPILKPTSVLAKSGKLGKLFDAVKVKTAALDSTVTEHLPDSNNI